MFTGLIRHKGLYMGHQKKSGFNVLHCRIEGLEDAHKGDSIAVDGVCLTLTGKESSDFYFDVSEETMDRSSLKNRKVNDILNIEPSLKAGDRIGGHFVYGHIDTTGKLEGIFRHPSNMIFRFSVKKDNKYVIEKGSIAINGVSLTISRSISPGLFEVSVIPETIEGTNLKDIRQGDPVNVEYDMLIKYLNGLVKNVR